MTTEQIDLLDLQLAEHYEPWIDDPSDPRNDPFYQLDKRLLPASLEIDLDPETLRSFYAKPICAYRMQKAVVSSLPSLLIYQATGILDTIEEDLYTVVADSHIHPLSGQIKGIDVSFGGLRRPLLRQPNRYKPGSNPEHMGVVHTHPNIKDYVVPSIISEIGYGQYAGDLYSMGYARQEALRKAPGSPRPVAVDRPLMLILQPGLNYQDVTVLSFREGEKIAQLSGKQFVTKLYEMARYMSDINSQDGVMDLLKVFGYKASFTKFDWDQFFKGYPLFSEKQLSQLEADILD